MQWSRAPLLLFFDRMTDNGLIVECQSLLSIAFYEHMSTESMKVTKICDKIHAHFFSNSQRMGFVEQFSKEMVILLLYLSKYPLNRTG